VTRGRYPNSRMASHQLLRHDEDKRIEAHSLAPDFTPNRAQRRDYVRHNQTRYNRMKVVGWGRWARHKESQYETYAAATAIALTAPRVERRPHMIRQAKIDRWIRRRAWKRQTLPSAIKSAFGRLVER
jgi:hypothetical protein